MARPRSALSKFILSLPRDLPVKEVIVRAKAKGLKTDESNVYRVRRLSKAKTTPKPEALSASTKSKASSTKPFAVPTNKPPTSKIGFIRSLPSNLPVAEVVVKAKAEGLKITESYVRWTRWQAKSGAKKRSRKTTVKTMVTKLAARSARTPRKAASVRRPITTTSSAEDLLRALGAEIGLGRAVGILVDERAKLRAVIGA